MLWEVTKERKSNMEQFVANLYVVIEAANKEEAKKLLKCAKNTLRLDWPQIDVRSIYLVKEELVA
jgi:uncharacterized membrane protein YvbJ